MTFGQVLAVLVGRAGLALIAGAIHMSTSAEAGPALEGLFGCAPALPRARTTCVITANDGSDPARPQETGVDRFTAAAAEARREGVKIVINVDCFSACALFADRARPQVCIGRHANFAFHQVKFIHEGRE